MPIKREFKFDRARILITWIFCRALESTVKKHASSSPAAAGTFPGQGKSLSGSAAAAPGPAGSNDGIFSTVYGYYSGLDPQLKILVWVLVAYVGLMKLA